MEMEGEREIRGICLISNLERDESSNNQELYCTLVLLFFALKVEDTFRHSRAQVINGRLCEEFLSLSLSLFRPVDGHAGKTRRR